MPPLSKAWSNTCPRWPNGERNRRSPGSGECTVQIELLLEGSKTTRESTNSLHNELLLLSAALIKINNHHVEKSPIILPKTVPSTRYQHIKNSQSTNKITKEQAWSASQNSMNPTGRHPGVKTRKIWPINQKRLKIWVYKWIFHLLYLSWKTCCSGEKSSIRIPP